ncbi:MAG: hypothetical protein AAGK02_00805 [Pseudomonadota bacterium]
MRNVIAMAGLVLSLGGAAEAADWAVALPEAHPEGKAALEQPMWDVFKDVIGPGDRYRVMNGSSLGRIALINVPEHDKFARAKRRARYFQEQNALIYKHLQGMAAGPSALDLVGVLRHEAVNRIDASEPHALLIIGDAAQVFEGEPSFSMRDPKGVFRVPSDAHFSARLSSTPWGLGSEGAAGLRNVTVHLCHSGAAARLNDAEEEALRRFWGLYVSARGGTLATWSKDLPTCFERFVARVTTPVVDAEPNPHDRLLVMRKIGRAKVGTVDATSPHATGKTVINGVEVENFNLFADKLHPTLSSVKVVTGVRYVPAEYPDRYDAAWCYFSIHKSGTVIKFDLGSKRHGDAPIQQVSTASARAAAGITVRDFDAGKRACQWPTP